MYTVLYYTIPYYTILYPHLAIPEAGLFFVLPCFSVFSFTSIILKSGMGRSFGVLPSLSLCLYSIFMFIMSCCCWFSDVIDPINNQHVCVFSFFADGLSPIQTYLQMSLIPSEESSFDTANPQTQNPQTNNYWL